MIWEVTNRLTGFEHFYGPKDVNNNDDDSDDDNYFDGKDNHNDDNDYDGKDANDDDTRVGRRVMTQRALPRAAKP